MSQYQRANERENHCEGKEASAMTETPTDDKPGFVAEEPEHCHACYRLIQPGWACGTIRSVRQGKERDGAGLLRPFLA